MRHLALALALTLAAAGSAAAQPPAPAAASAAAKFGPDSTFQELMASPKAKAILDTNVPMIVMAYEMDVFPGEAPLKDVAGNPDAQSQGGFTPEAYKKILEELAKL